MVEVRPIDDSTRGEAVRLLAEHWGSPLIVSKGKPHAGEALPGYLAFEGGVLKGLITFNIENEECEIVSLDSLFENHGIGTMLIDKVTQTAQAQGCRRVWLITTNDNTHAIRFYQRRRFTLTAIYIDAIQASRKLKPQIPLRGFDGIPILHEIEFERVLKGGKL